MKKKSDHERFLPFKHLPTKGKERSFTCELLQKSGRFRLYKPDKQFLLQLVKFGPGKGLPDFVKFYDELDRRLLKKYGQTRHEMGFHEIFTFVTSGLYDMVVLWDAPNLDTANKILAETINPALKTTFHEQGVLLLLLLLFRP